LSLALSVVLTPAVGIAQQPSGTNYANFDNAFAAPALSGVGTATLTYTAGNLYLGGTVKAITAGTLTSLGATKNNCDAPAYSSCEIVYWTSGTSLSHSVTYATAFAAGNIPVAYVTTDGSSNVLTIVAATLSPDGPPGFTFPSSTGSLPNGVMC